MGMDGFFSFPHMDDTTPSALRRTIDEGFRNSTRSYGDILAPEFIRSGKLFSIWTMPMTKGLPLGQAEGPPA